MDAFDDVFDDEDEPVELVGIATEAGEVLIKPSLLPLRSISLAAARSMSLTSVPKKHPMGFNLKVKC